MLQLPLAKSDLASLRFTPAVRPPSTLPSTAPVHSVAADAASGFVAALHSDGQLLMWGTRHGELRRRTRAHRPSPPARPPLTTRHRALSIALSAQASSAAPLGSSTTTRPRSSRRSRCSGARGATRRNSAQFRAIPRNSVTPSVTLHPFAAQLRRDFADDALRRQLARRPRPYPRARRRRRRRHRPCRSAGASPGAPAAASLSLPPTRRAAPRVVRAGTRLRNSGAFWRNSGAILAQFWRNSAQFL